MKEPRGADLLATLIELLADQEGVKIEYEITSGRNDDGEHDRNSSGNGRYREAHLGA